MKPREKKISKNKLVDMLKLMLKIRLSEERIADYIEDDEITTPCHLYIGEEAIAAGAISAINNRDYVYSNYRGHGHYIAKGGSLKKLISEVFCKRTGCSMGKGGSMHIVSKENNLMGNSAIVAGNIGLAAGTALKIKMLNEDKVSMVFIGDGATEEGVFAETINFASLKKLPLIIICENNDFAAHMRLADRQPIKKMSIKTKAYMPSYTLDGNNVLMIYKVVQQAVQRAKKGMGPTFVECVTMRLRGHVGPRLDIDKGLRTKEELDYWRKKSPITLLEKKLIKNNTLTKEEIGKIRKGLTKEVDEAFMFSQESDKPNKDDLLKDVYVGEKE